MCPGVSSRLEVFHCHQFVSSYKDVCSFEKWEPISIAISTHALSGAIGHYSVTRETGSVSCRIEPWDCFGDADASFITNLRGKPGQNSSFTVLFETIPSQSQTETSKCTTYN